MHSLTICNQTPLTKEGFLSLRIETERNLPTSMPLSYTWTDSYGRVVAQGKETVQPEGHTVWFSLSLDRAVALENHLTVRLLSGARPIFEESVSFVVTPEPLTLEDYNVIMYYPYEREKQHFLRDIGVTAGQSQNVIGQMSREKGGAWWHNGFRFYCDQMATEYYAHYHSPRYHPKGKLHEEARELYAKDRTRREAFYRNPCFHDPDALQAILAKIEGIVKSQSEFKPLFYSTDECGVAELVGPMDFCFDPRTLHAMRAWLMKKYGSLEGINREWGTDFASLEEVAPFTSDEALDRLRAGDYNLSPWLDHRLFMNLTFASVVRAATDAVHRADPEAKNGIVGCQTPSAFGGYDYWNLSTAIDIIEPYNIGNNRKMWQSFAPKKPAFTTFFACNDFELWRLWYQALMGDRGIIIYDEKNCYLDAQGKPTPDYGVRAAPVFKELTGGIIRQLSALDLQEAQVALHYSHPSITAWWPFELLRLDADWVKRTPWADWDDFKNPRVRGSVAKLLEDNQTPYRFTAYAELENGSFEKAGQKLLVLSLSLAMSEGELAAVKRFVRGGGTVVADCSTALMNGNGKLRSVAGLDEVFGVVRSGLEFAAMKERPAETLQPCNGDRAVGEYSWAKGLSTLQLSGVKLPEETVEVAEDAVALFRDGQGVPGVIVHNYGLGKAIYLNMDLSQYFLKRTVTGGGASELALWKAVLDAAGVQPKVKTRHLSGGETKVEVNRYLKEEIELVTLLRNYELRQHELGETEYRKQADLQQECKIQVDLGRKAFVYDSRHGKFLGETDTLTLDIPKWEPIILALLPNPVGGMKVTGPAKAEPGSLVTVHTELENAGGRAPHVFRFRVRCADDPTLDLRMHDANIETVGGKTVFTFPLAVSDPKGSYEIIVQDVVTGVTGKHTVTVE